MCRTTADRRGPRQLASTVEDATALLSSILMSPTFIPAAAGAVADTAPSSSAATAGMVTAGLDYLSAVFRLGLACEKATPGEASACLRAAPPTTVKALADFIATTSLPLRPQAMEERTAAAAAGDGGKGNVSRGCERELGTFERRAICRASACARWLACRFLSVFEGGEQVVGGRGSYEQSSGGDEDCRSRRKSWAGLRRDCALQVSRERILKRRLARAL